MVGAPCSTRGTEGVPAPGGNRKANMAAQTGSHVAFPYLPQKWW